MKTLLVSFIFGIVAVSCSTVDEDCMCTMEYHYTLVTVVNTLGVPVDSLTVTIKDKDGDELDVQQEPSLFGSGKYVVLSDSFTHIMCNCGTPQPIYFSATDGNRSAAGDYLFNTDDCRCHINKVEGPDTLVLR